MTGALLALAVVLAATGFGLWWRRRQGRFAPVAAPLAPALTGLGVAPGVVTLLQFSSATCAPCHATRRLLADVAASHEQIEHVELDVDDHLDAVRDLDVRRTPTLFVLGPDGRVALRASGLPTRSAVEDALAPLLVAR